MTKAAFLSNALSLVTSDKPLADIHCRLFQLRPQIFSYTIKLYVYSKQNNVKWIENKNNMSGEFISIFQRYGTLSIQHLV